LKLARNLPLALQVPLLMVTERYEGPEGIRVPQAGWTAEPLPDGSRPTGKHKKHRGTYQRTHRHMHIRRFEDPLATARENRLAHVLFSTAPSELGLYDKPMARNVQIWDENYRLILDGPRAKFHDLRRAADVLAEGGWFCMSYTGIGRSSVICRRDSTSRSSCPKRRPAISRLTSPTIPIRPGPSNCGRASCTVTCMKPTSASSATRRTNGRIRPSSTSASS
jgi:hypothetical protein